MRGHLNASRRDGGATVKGRNLKRHDLSEQRATQYPLSLQFGFDAGQGRESLVELSAAESASSGLKGELEDVFIELDRSRVIIESVGNKGLLVVVTNTKENHDNLHEQVKKVIRDLISLI